MSILLSEGQVNNSKAIKSQNKGNKINEIFNNSDIVIFTGLYVKLCKV